MSELFHVCYFNLSNLFYIINNNASLVMLALTEGLNNSRTKHINIYKHVYTTLSAMFSFSFSFKQ